MLAADHRQHEVDRGLTARAGGAIAVDFEDLLRDDGALELLGELLIGFPVDAHTIAGQLPRHRQPPDAVMNAGDERRTLADAREAREKQAVIGELLEPLADDDQPVARDRVAESGIGRPMRAARERHGAAVPRADLHAVQRAAVDFIGEIEGVHNRPDA